jgi:hypothetical protein
LVAQARFVTTGTVKGGRSERNSSKERTDPVSVNFCPQCGASAPAGSQFCGSCGTLLGQRFVPPVTGGAWVNPVPQPAVKQRRSIGRNLAIVAVGLIGLGALLSQMDSGSPQDPGGLFAGAMPSAREEPSYLGQPSDGDTAEPLPEELWSEEPVVDALEIELREAMDTGLVTAKGTGDGLERLSLQITSKSDQDLIVQIEAGTVLAPKSSSTQNMVVTTDFFLDLTAGSNETVSLEVACAQMHDDQPTADDGFKVQMLDPKSDLLKLLRLERFGDEDFRVRQFAIWTITDNPSRDGYQGLGTAFDIYGSGPSDEEMARIRSLFKDAKIPAGHYRAL